VPSALNNGLRSPRKLLEAVVRRLVAALRAREHVGAGVSEGVSPSPRVGKPLVTMIALVIALGIAVWLLILGLCLALARSAARGDELWSRAIAAERARLAAVERQRYVHHRAA
jgi:hypothetical protein